MDNLEKTYVVEDKVVNNIGWRIYRDCLGFSTEIEANNFLHKNPSYGFLAELDGLFWVTEINNDGEDLTKAKVY